MKKKKEDLLIFSVDDDKDERFFIKEAFCELVDESQLRFFSNGIELIDTLTKGQMMPDVRFIDLNMPLMSGREALDLIKKNPSWKDIPVVIFSTSNYDQDSVRCIEAGAMRYICKPSSMMEYPQIFNDVLNQLLGC